MGALGALGITSSRKFASGDKKVEWTGLMREARLAIVDETQPFMRQDLSSRQIWPTGESAVRLLVPACLPWQPGCNRGRGKGRWQLRSIRE